MRMLRLACLVAGALVAGACSGTAATTAPTRAPTAAPASAAATGGSTAGISVAIKNFAFAPASATVAPGGTVTWTNGDSADHTVTFDDAKVTSSGNLGNAATFAATFPAAGSFPYRCAIHPSMKGTVTVS